MSQVQGFINDGYTLNGYIAERPRLHPALRFKFRAILQSRRAVIARDYRMAVAAGEMERAEAVAAKAVAEQVIEWDLKGADGQPVPVTAANVLKIHPEMNERLYLIAMGKDAPDIDPLDDPLASHSTEEADAKN